MSDHEQEEDEYFSANELEDGQLGHGEGKGGSLESIEGQIEGL